MVEKIYPRSVGVVLSTINDIVELQKAQLTFSDTPSGKINFVITMYAYKWEICFTVIGIGRKQSRVSLEVAGDQLGRADIFRREFSLLESLLDTSGQNAEKKQEIYDGSNGKPNFLMAKEYIDNNWQGDYSAKTIAKSVNMSKSKLYAIFNQFAGMTPGEYHKKVKLDHIKEKLADKSLSVKEAFAACGEDSQGRVARVFKEKTGLSPTEYRDSLVS